MENKQDRILRGAAKAMSAQAQRATDAARQQSKMPDSKSTVAVDLRTCIGAATNLPPEQTVKLLTQ